MNVLKLAPATAGLLSRVMFFGLAAITLTAHAQTQSYPVKPIRLILPYLGGTDPIARWIAAKLSPALGKQVVVEPRIGAAGNLGHVALAKSAPDGYTLMLGAPPMVVNPHLHPNVGYDWQHDYAPIALIATMPNVLAVHPLVPAKTLGELVQIARRHPNKLTYGSGGIGLTSHLAVELLKSLSKTQILHIPYKGATFALVGAMSGESDMVVPAAAAAEPYVRDGRMRALVVLDTKRVGSMPQVPTSAEAGMPQLLILNWYVVLAPAGTPRPIIDRLHDETVKVMQTPESRDYFALLGADIVTNTPEQSAEFVRAEFERWGKVVRAAHIKME